MKSRKFNFKQIMDEFGMTFISPDEEFDSTRSKTMKEKRYCSFCGSEMIEGIARIEKWFDSFTGRSIQRIYKKWTCPNKKSIFSVLSRHPDINEWRGKDGGGSF